MGAGAGRVWMDRIKSDAAGHPLPGDRSPCPLENRISGNWIEGHRRDLGVCEPVDEPSSSCASSMSAPVALSVERDGAAPNAPS